MAQKVTHDCCIIYFLCILCCLFVGSRTFATWSPLAEGIEFNHPLPQPPKL